MMDFISPEGDYYLSCENHVLSLNSITDEKSQIINEGIRYGIYNADVWALTGEYFAVHNMSAHGWEEYDTPADLLAVPLENQPSKIQFDVFNKDSEFQSYIILNFYTDGRNVEGFFWIRDNMICIIKNIFSSGTYKSYLKIVDVTGNVLFESEYDCYLTYYSGENYDRDGGYFRVIEKDKVSIKYVDFTMDRTIKEIAGDVDYSSVTEMLINPREDCYAMRIAMPELPVRLEIYNIKKRGQ
jgi:hypothetical protein